MMMQFPALNQRSNRNCRFGPTPSPQLKEETPCASSSSPTTQFRIDQVNDALSEAMSYTGASA
jgi:hypothetical protein